MVRLPSLKQFDFAVATEAQTRNGALGERNVFEEMPQTRRGFFFVTFMHVSVVTQFHLYFFLEHFTLSPVFYITDSI
jgi:hypothetical protein